MKKLLSILLVAVLILSALSACGQAASPATAAPTAAPAAAAPAPDSDPQPAQPEAPATALPLSDKGETLSIWMRSDANFSAMGMTSAADSTAVQELEKRTGIKLEVQHPSVGQEVEGFNLLMASDELPDLIEVYHASYNYSGGFDKAIEDGVFLRLNELIDSFAPNYKSIIESSPDLLKSAITDEGNLPGFFTIDMIEQGSYFGPLIRKDWLDSLGLPIPVTYDDWHATLTAFKEKKGATAPLILFYTGFTAMPGLNSGYGFVNPLYMENGKVQYAPLSAGYKEYIAMMAQWYQEGLIDPDFNTKRTFFPDDSLTLTGASGLWYSFYTMIDLYNMMGIGAGMAEPPVMIPIQNPVKNAGDKLHARLYNERVGKQMFVVSADCENPELAVKLMDYLFSPDGELLGNYGIEGETYTLVDGEPIFNEMITNNPDGRSFGELMTKYSIPFTKAYRWERETQNLSEIGFTAMDLWTEAGHELNMPTVSLSADEGKEYARIMGDITTYVDETSVKFILGAEPLSNFDKFVETIKSMGIDDALALQQAALDRFNKR
ncbi:MAG: extracellular solute-binding protein [Clostridiales bacterium]|jgi:putative aldouronate transport system substrate-binding protein|nr:extracellular solute-binding protein [Clostridiales bacterium]